MPVDATVRKSVEAVRERLATPPKNDGEASELFCAVDALFQESEKIAADGETLGAVLDLRAELDGYRGKGKRFAVRWFDQGVGFLAYRLLERLDEAGPEDSASGDAAVGVAKLADFTFGRVQGPRVRSRTEASRRAMAWETLGLVSQAMRRPEHLAHALKVAADARSAEEERTAAVGFLPEYWGEDEPDEATVSVLRALESNPASRDLLVTVLQAQIQLGLKEEFGALMAVGDWDDEDYDEED